MEIDFDTRVRLAVYEGVIRNGVMPSRMQLAVALEVLPEEVGEALARLAEAHMLVLQPSGEVLMANPFSAVPTPFLVRIGGSGEPGIGGPEGAKQFYGNCIWDALGISTVLRTTVRLETACGCCGDQVAMSVREGRVERRDWVAHFALPARRWWDDVVFT